VLIITELTGPCDHTSFFTVRSHLQGATDNDLEKIARVCQGLSTLDCSGCPRIGDIGVTHLIPKMVHRKKADVLMGTPKLRSVYFYGTSVRAMAARASIEAWGGREGLEFKAQC